MNIWYSSKENAILSNLSPRRFVDKKGRVYVSVEHAYQTLKSGTFCQETYDMKWTGGKKFFGKRRMNPDVNLEIMYRIIKTSFEQNPYHLEALLKTGDAILTHKQDKGIWKDKFPEILMRVRKELS